MNRVLYVIIPFFSFGNFSLREKNLKITLDHLSLYSNIKIIVIEGHKENNKTLNLNKYKNINHIKLKLPSTLWIKENLINIAIKSLPKDWEYVAWVDADIIFLNQNWAEETIDKLQKVDVVQLFKFIINLDNSGNVHINNNLAYHNKPILPGIIFANQISPKYTYAPTGFGWALNKKFYEKIGGLFEFNIIGAGDFMFAICCLNVFSLDKTYFRTPPTENYIQLAEKYAFNFKNTTYDCINGSVCHLWHGDLIKRKYEERWNILIKNQFSPNLDLCKDDFGVIYIKDKKQLEKDITDYFIERED